MKTLLFYYVAVINVLGFCLMGIDKWKARRGLWRIPEKTLFLTAFFGGGIGAFVGMYIFRHKTRKLRFAIGLPVLLVLQILCVLFFFLYRQEQISSPSTAVSRELNLIQNLDDATIQSFISYETLISAPSSDASIGPETTEAVELFFKNFQYHIHSEEITGDTALVTAEIINLDTKALATDLCLALTARNLNLGTDSPVPETMNDYFTLLRDTLQNHSYDLIATTAYFHLTKNNTTWIIQADETLQDQLVSGFITWINDDSLLSPETVLSVYLDAFSSLTASEWLDYLEISDIFSIGSETLASKVDQTYMEKITEFFDYKIESCQSEGSLAQAKVIITSIDMSAVLNVYNDKLLSYAHTARSITSDDAELSDASAAYLLEALEEAAAPADFAVTVTLFNDGHTWQLEISEELTNAFLGNMAEALETFA